MVNSNSSNKREREDEPLSNDQKQNKRIKSDGENRIDERRNNEAGLSDSTPEEETPPHIPPMDTSFMDNLTTTDPSEEKKEYGNDNQPIRWGCDYCKKAIFDTLDEARDHEKSCPERPDKHKQDAVDGIESSNPPHRWGCDYCDDAVFDTFDEARDHEKICPERPNEDDNNKTAPDEIHSKSTQESLQNNAHGTEINIKLKETDKIQWMCEHCEEAIFDTHEQACEHEFGCKFNPNNNDETTK